MRKNTLADVLAKIGPVVDERGCRLWTGARDPDGYGLIKWQGRTVRATRLIWSLVRGPIPNGLWVLHSCDRPQCANPDHFFLGNDEVNRADCVAKGRTAKGARNGRHTMPERTARGERHGSQTQPDRLARGPRNARWGKAALVKRGSNGRFITADEVR